MTATDTTTIAPRTGMIVKYHGTHKTFHGMLFKITASYQHNGQRKFNLAHYRDPGKRTVMSYARAQSLTVVRANTIVTRTCAECGLEHVYERSELLAGVSCALALPAE